MNTVVDQDPRFADTFACVEATSMEQLECWARWSTESADAKPTDKQRRMLWKQDNPGSICTVGELAGHRVCISVSWDIVAGHRVLFWEATSRVVDYDMVKKWLEERTPNAKERTNAMNFHNVAHAISDRIGAQPR